MKKFTKIICLLVMIALMIPAVVACGGGSGKAERITFWASTNQHSAEAWTELIKEYNETQGKTDNVYVKMSPKAKGYSANIGTNLQSKEGIIDVVGINDRYFKDYASQGWLVNLSELIADESKTIKDADGNPLLSLSEYNDNQLDRFRIDPSTKQAGNGKDLYAIPGQTDSTLMLYNKTLFESSDINIISIPESQLESYNSANGTSFANCGYAEYATSPAPNMNLRQSRNLNGEAVYKVFNNQISMSWAQLRTLSKLFTKTYNGGSVTDYGFFTEWWFGYGWGVGGDCLNYDAVAQKYVFSLGSELTNYLTTDNVTINGTSYESGKIISYQDKQYLSTHPDDSAFNKLYPLPSQYDAFAEFVALSQERSKKVDDTKYGYGISPSPATLNNASRATFFTAQHCAMVYTYFSDCNDISEAAKFNYDACPVVQYREYEGGEERANGDIKVIDGTFTGEIKTQNGVEIKGKATMVSEEIGWAIPSNSEHKEAAYKFIQWLVSKQAQEKLLVANDMIPCSSTLRNSDAFLKASTNLFGNYAVVSTMADVAELGDWSYLENNQWVGNWSDTLNTTVRNGEMTLNAFFVSVTNSTNAMIQNYRIKILGK